MIEPVLACSICFGHTDPAVAYVMMGMLSVPFLLVGGMFGFLYYRGVFGNPGAENGDDAGISPTP